MGEVKQTNFRIDSETADAFRKFCDEHGLNQAQGFDHIMQIVEMDNAKVTLPERATDIESFEMHVKALTEAYLYNLAITSETEARVKEQFKTALEQRDQTIRDMQQKAAEMKTELDAAKDAVSYAESHAAMSKQETERFKKDAEAAQKLADEKDRTNGMLTSKLTEAEGKLTGYDALKKSEQDLREQVDKLTRQLEHEQEQAKQNALNAQKDAEMHEMKALESLRTEMRDQIQQLREDKAALQAKLELLTEQPKQ